MCENSMDPADGYADLESAAFLDKYEIRDVNYDGREDILFYVTEQNCKTKVIQKRKRIFLRVGECFIEKGSTKPSGRKTCAGLEHRSVP